MRAGFTWGQVRIARLRTDEIEDGDDLDSMCDDLASAGDAEATMLIPFQNENLCAYLENTDSQGDINRKVCRPIRAWRTPVADIHTAQVVASVPDLITILDSQSGSHLGTPECMCWDIVPFFL